METTITLPKKPELVREERNKGVFEIENLYPGYGVTIGNALRRVILGSIPGAAITAVRVKGVSHEFSTIEGVLEDVIEVILNIKQIRVKLIGDEPQKISLKVNGAKKGEVKAGDIETPSQVEIINKEQHIATITDKKISLEMEMDVERGIGYVPAEVRQKEKLPVGMIALDAIFTPIRRVNFEAENMRVGDKTDFNKIILTIETDGTITPKEVLNRGIEILVDQFGELAQPRAGEKKEKDEEAPAKSKEKKGTKQSAAKEDAAIGVLEQSVRELDASPRVTNILLDAKIKTIGKLIKKKEADLMEVKGLGGAGVKELNSKLAKFNLSFKK